jgi:hypothetical protein
MEIRSLIILAAKADSEGNFRVADRLTAKIETMSREARGIDLRFLGPLTRDLIKGLTSGFKPKATATHTEKFKGKFFTPEDYKKIVDSHNAELTARATARKGPGAAAPGTTQTAPGGAPVAQAAAGPGPIHQSAGGTPTGPAVPGTIHQTAPGGAPTAQAAATANPTINIKPGKNGRDGRDGRDGADGIQGIQGLKGDTGPQGPAGKWWPGVVAGLLGGAIGTGGVAAWLASKGADSASISQIEDRLDNHFKANQLSARTQAGQMDNQQAAQDFIESRRGNPKFNTAQDFYYEAQRMGYPPSMMNSIAALAKAEGFQDLTRFQD